jgi:hypothetical protein
MTVGNELIMGAVPPERAGAAAAVVLAGAASAIFFRGVQVEPAAAMARTAQAEADKELIAG